MLLQCQDKKVELRSAEDYFFSQNQNQDSEPAFSPHHQQYTKIVKGCLPQQALRIRELATAGGFEWMPSAFPKLIRTVVESREELLKVQVCYGNFRTFICIHNINASVERYERTKIGEGQYACVYKTKKGEKQFACKVIKISQQKKNFLYDDILREVFMVKLASALGVGPSFSNIYGYDLLINSDSAEYAMELCQVCQLMEHQIPPQRKEKFETLEQILFHDCIENLRVLHSLRFVHRDIKPQNIGWSKIRKKFIFLDYGFGGFVKEQVGSLTTTNFIGTVLYSCEEMKKLFFLKSSGLVDLYHNDLCGVEKSVKFLQSTVKNKQILDELTENQEIQELWNEFQLLMSFSFGIIQGNYALAAESYNCSKLKHLLERVERRYQKFLNGIKMQSYFQQCENKTKDSHFDRKFLKIFYGYLHPQISKQHLFEESIDSLFLHKKRIKQFWKKDQKMMNLIFSFIFDHLGDISRRTKLLSLIFTEVFPYQNIENGLKKLSFLLEIFSKYFSDVRDIEPMKKITKCFSIIYNYQSQKQNDEKILQHLKNVSPQSYLEYLLQMFVVHEVTAVEVFDFQHYQHLLENIGNQGISQKAQILKNALKKLFRDFLCRRHRRPELFKKFGMNSSQQDNSQNSKWIEMNCEYLNNLKFFSMLKRWGKSRMFDSTYSMSQFQNQYFRTEVELYKLIYFKEDIGQNQTQWKMAHNVGKLRLLRQQEADEIQRAEMIEQLIEYGQCPCRVFLSIFKFILNFSSEPCIEKISKLIEDHQTQLFTSMKSLNIFEVVEIIVGAQGIKDLQQFQIVNKIIKPAKIRMQKLIEQLKQIEPFCAQSNVKGEIMLLEALLVYQFKESSQKFEVKFQQYLDFDYTVFKNEKKIDLGAITQINKCKVLIQKIPHLKEKNDCYMLQKFQLMLDSENHFLNIFHQQADLDSVILTCCKYKKWKTLIRIFTDQKNKLPNSFPKFHTQNIGALLKGNAKFFPSKIVTETIDHYLVTRKLSFSDLSRDGQYSHILNELGKKLPNSSQNEWKKMRISKLVAFGTEIQEIPLWAKKLHLKDLSFRILLRTKNISPRKKIILSRNIFKQLISLENFQKNKNNKSRKFRHIENIAKAQIEKKAKAIISNQKEQNELSRIILQKVKQIHREIKQSGQFSKGSQITVCLDIREELPANIKKQFGTGIVNISHADEKFSLLVQVTY